jgi:transcriptional regulator with XRE-family HTH domain
MNLKTRQQQAKRIAATRGLSLLTLQEFERRTGFAASTMNTLETRFTNGITARTWKRLADAFRKIGVEVSIDFLKEGKGAAPVNMKLASKGWRAPETVIKQIRAILD